MTKMRTSSGFVPNAKKVSGPYTGGPAKALLHATISPSMSLPGYSSQATAPHETIRWDPRRKIIIPGQHYYYDNFAKSLRNLSGGVETNRDSVLQWELAGYLGANGHTVPKGEFDILLAPNTYWEQVANHIGPVIQSWGIKPAIYPTRNGRMTLSQWDNFSGLCTHADCPENDHWDLPIPEEAFNILAAKVWGKTTVDNRPPASSIPSLPTNPPFPLYSGHYYGRFNRTNPKCHSGTYSATDRRNIRVWQTKMYRRGWKNIGVADGIFGDKSYAVAKAFQAEKGLTATGGVGSKTWRATWQAPIT